ncbi:MAG TPA: hypothetical protein VFJ90_08810 [Candidatus Didemnitutus sp.]|nr:hypothetical protein [Candidatus Didemnitutus sp.]
MKCRLVGILTLTGAAFLLGGCGKAEAPVASTAAAETGVNGAREIAITANDQMKYSITEIRVQPGDKAARLHPARTRARSRIC